jgi:hypothetical protein
MIEQGQMDFDLMLLQLRAARYQARPGDRPLPGAGGGNTGRTMKKSSR